MAGVITVSEPSWMGPFTGLSPRQFNELITTLRREGAGPVRRGRPWSLPLQDRVLLVAAYWRTNLALRRLAPLFGVSKPAADRIVDHLGPALALQPRRRFRKNTVLIVDGTLVPTPRPGRGRLQRHTDLIEGRLAETGLSLNTTTQRKGQ
ncbi:hypothetical protein SUDANB176_07402 [Streptomyces sp. enrichment culture]